MANLPICNEDTPDPWMLAANGRFYLTCTLGDRVEIWSSSTMENFRNCQKSIVWRPAPGSPWSENIWAPELHYLNSSWYIYTAGASPGQGHESHRTLVLRSDNQDPMHAPSWSFLGPLKGLPDHWHIDATVFSPAPNELYCCYSGWPLGDHSDLQQDLFLIKMASPEQAVPDTLVCISRAQLPWERCDGNRHGINEGPSWVDASPCFRGIVYSCSGSWTNDYKLALLQFVGNDILSPNSWKKRETPLLVSDNKPPFGPGHASFVKSPYRPDQVYCIYHATEKPDEGWRNRKGRVVCLDHANFMGHARSLCCGDMGPHQQQMAAPQAGGQSSRYPGQPASGPAQQQRGFFSKMKDRLDEL